MFIQHKYGTKRKPEMTHPTTNKKIKSAILTIVALAALATHHISLAADPNSGAFFGNSAKGKWIIGGKVAKVDLNGPDVQDADAAGIVLGYEFARSIGDLDGSSTVEFEYITGDARLDSLGLNYDVNVANLYFAYRSAGTLYYKVKGGLSYADFEFTDSEFAKTEFEDVGLAFGIGLGYRVGELGVIELEYSANTSDADLGIIAVNALLQF
jgi:hypothetical protein